MVEKENKYRFYDYIKRNMLILFLIVISIIISVIVPVFLSIQNILNVLTQIAINAMLSTGMTFVIISGGIDLSVGSIAAFSGIAVTSIIVKLPNITIFESFIIGIGISILVGLACGGFSAIAIAKLNVTPFIATLAMMSIARGITYVITKSRPIFGLPDTFGWLGQKYIFGAIPVIVIIMIVVLSIAHIVLDKTSFGRYIYAVGSNEEVAKLSGINVDRIKISVYVISGILSAFGGVCLASKLATGQPTAGSGYELNAIAAVVMGGTSLSGGRGSMGKTVLGLLTIGIINNGLSLMKVSSYWQTIAMGLIILIAVSIDQLKLGKK
ncbi:MAG: ribose ABC transporter permease [Spirochaetes bacterium]|nr:MAG: ribose ABC transporter permease [Spirochaetota bacterium]